MVHAHAHTLSAAETDAPSLLERHVSAEARGEALSGVSPVGLFRTDAAGRCLAVNARWCEITGLAEAEALREGWARALHRDDRERVLTGWRQATSEGRGFEAELRFRRPDGTVAQVLAQALPERDPDGRISGFVGAVTDLSRHLEVAQERIEQRKQAEAESERHNEQLRSLALRLALAQEHERRRIAAGLHDEVGQLLAVAQAKLGQLMASGASGDVSGEAGEIRALLDRAIEETRALTFELSSPVLHELGLAAAVESLCERLSQESGVEFRVETDGEPESLGEDLRTLLYRTVRELCRNVVRHARAPRAEVRLSTEGDRIQIVVADDGEGFDASEHTRRFDTAGGFGLFAIREMCAHVEGRFEIESAAGEGARAVLSVPLG